MTAICLVELLEHYQQLADTDVIYAEIPFSLNSRAIVADEDDVDFAEPKGYDRFVSVDCVQGMLYDFPSEKSLHDKLLMLIAEQDTQRLEMNRHLELNGGQFSADYLRTLLTDIETVNEEAQNFFAELAGEQADTKDV